MHLTAVSSFQKCTGVFTVFNTMYNGKGMQKNKKKDKTWKFIYIPSEFLPAFITSRMSMTELPQARYLLQVPCMFR